MRNTRVWITLSCCLLAVAVIAWAQGRKPGLWEVTSNMTWQQSPMPPGMTMPAGANSAFGGGPRTTQVCVTQAQIDRYGGPPPQTRGDCQVTNVQIMPTGMTANMTCTGRASGSGTVVATFLDSGHSTTKVHFTGTMTMGQNTRPIEWTMEATSSFKGPDCGSVQPVAVPGN